MTAYGWCSTHFVIYLKTILEERWCSIFHILLAMMMTAIKLASVASFPLMINALVKRIQRYFSANLQQWKKKAKYVHCVKVGQNEIGRKKKLPENDMQCNTRNVWPHFR